VEIIAEIIIQLLGWIFEIFGELLIQAVGELIFELLGHCIKEPFRRPKPIHPWVAAIAYAAFGAIAGAISLWLLPTLFISAHWLRIVNLFLTPFVAGILMAMLGAWRQRQEQEIIRLDRFSYGFCFAFSMAVVRFACGK
jgi:uncharacterized membrane protein